MAVLADEALHERQAELDAVAELLAAARGGAGAALTIEGAAGIGKTSLIAAMAALARDGGVRVLRARAGELEADLAWGVVRSLLTPAVARAPAAERAVLLDGAAAQALPALGLADPSADGDGLAGTLHGLYWLVANLAERGPLVIAVDDAHWADVPSQRFLAYLGARIDDLPVLLAVAVRSGEPGSASAALESLRSQPGARALRPHALTAAASAAVVNATFAGADAEFARACHEATGGNPYLLRELVRQLAADRVEPTAKSAPGVLHVSPRSVSRSVLLRMARLSHDARELARAVAVLGAPSAIAETAALARIDQARAVAAAEELAGADVLASGLRLEFAHPLVRAAVYDDLPPLRRSGWHWRAAQALRDHGQTDRAAAQLLAAEPAGERWAVEVLREAAEQAAVRGAPDVAASLLRRALEEPPPDDLRLAVLSAVGHAELNCWDPSCVDHLGQAAELAPSAVERAEIAGVLAQLLMHVGRGGEGVALCQRCLAELGDSEAERAQALRLEALLLDTVTIELSHADVGASLARTREPPPGDSVEEQMVLAALAARELGAGAADRAVSLARAALAGDRLLEETARAAPGFWVAVFALLFADELDEAEARTEQAHAIVRERGSVPGFAIVAMNRSLIALRRGRVREAEAEARHGLALAREAWPPAVPALLAVACESLHARGLLDDAASMLEAAGAGGPLPNISPALLLLLARGRLRIASGDADRGLADLREAGVRAAAAGQVNPAFLPWRSAAGELIDEEIALARAAGSARAVGVALRARALAGDDADPIGLLEESVGALERSPDALELARSRVELGAALRRAGRRSDALDPLRAGLDGAARSGADAVAERARDELQLAGARPRRDAYAGRDALTAAELRVATLAAAGRTNKQIAQELFVSLRTVETHLTHVYRKLGISARPELATALAIAQSD